MILLVSDIGELKANPKTQRVGHRARSEARQGPRSGGDGPRAGRHAARRRHVHRRPDRRPRARAHRRSRPADEVGRPVDAGRSARPRPACRSRATSFQVADAAKARQIAAFREEQAKNKALGAKGGRLTLESLQAQIAEGGMKELPIIIKADVQGSAEVLADTLTKLTDEKVKIRIIHAGVGAVNESDVLLASASNAIIIAFNVRPDRNAEDIAARERVDIRLHSVIYNVTDEMKKAMTGLLEPTFKEVRHRRRRGPQHLQGPEVRHHRRLHGDRRPHHPRRRHPGAPAARQRRRLRGQDRLAPPLQGRRERGQGRLRVRHRLRAVQRPQGRRPHRGLRDGTGRGHA